MNGKEKEEQYYFIKWRSYWGTLLLGMLLWCSQIISKIFEFMIGWHVCISLWDLKLLYQRFQNLAVQSSLLLVPSFQLKVRPFCFKAQHIYIKHVATSTFFHELNFVEGKCYIKKWMGKRKRCNIILSNDVHTEEHSYWVCFYDAHK